MKMRRVISRYAALVAVAVGVLAGCGPSTPDALIASAKDYLAKNDRNAAVFSSRPRSEDPDNAEGHSCSAGAARI